MPARRPLPRQDDGLLIYQILSVVAPVFCCAAIGFVWARLGRPFDTRMVGSLALNLGMPCLVFSTLTGLEISAGAIATIALAYGIALVAFVAVGFGCILLLRLPVHTFLPAFTSANTGNMGLPLCLFAFGQEGLALSIGVFVLSSLFSFTVGWSLYAGRVAFDILYKNPLIYAIAIALPMALAGIRPPAWLANTTELIGGLAIPLMLVSLGVAIAGIRARGAARVIAVSVVKLGAGFLVGYGLALALGLEGVARGVLIIGCSMPVAVHNFMFAQYFDRRLDDTAGLILFSTMISLATLPLLMLAVL